MSFFPYVKYVLAPDTRFERDHKIFFGPQGKVAKGELLINYGWGYGGLKEFVKAYYNAKGKNPQLFKTYYEKLRQYRGNLLEELSSDGLLLSPLRGLITARIHKSLFIPILIVDFLSVQFKYCESCLRLWEERSLPPIVEECLGIDKQSNIIRELHCTRMACNHLCGNYGECVLNYTSLEEDSDVEKKILDCLAALIQLLRENIDPPRAFECRKTESDNKPKRVAKLYPNQKCFERPVRYDFKPIRRRHMDPKTWENIQNQRIDHGAHHIIDLIPSKLMPDIFRDEIKRTDVIAPLEAKNVLENFIKMANLRFEIKIDLSIRCTLCGGYHRIYRVPISATFKTDQAYIQEAGFGRILWKLLWKEFPQEMCKIYSKDYKIGESPVLKRELKVSNLLETSSRRDYDYAVDLLPLTGNSGWLLFNLTTGLWKKSGFHESSLDTRDYIEYEKDMLVNIPSKLENAKSIWYIVVPRTEEQFFDESAPENIANMNMLIDTITDGKNDERLIPVVVFNSTPRAGEARTELRRLTNEKMFPRTRIYSTVNKLLQEVKTT